MLNYTINKEDSKTFIRYYKEKDDSIVVHYADKTKLFVENTEEMKKKLNRIEEEQIKKFNNHSKTSLEDIVELGCDAFAAAFIGSLAISGIGGFIGAMVAGGAGFIAVAKFSTLLYIPAALFTGVVIAYSIYEASDRKFKLFLNYKDRINEFLKEKNKE